MCIEVTPRDAGGLQILDRMKVLGSLKVPHVPGAGYHLIHRSLSRSELGDDDESKILVFCHDLLKIQKIISGKYEFKVARIESSFLLFRALCVDKWNKCV